MLSTPPDWACAVEPADEAPAALALRLLGSLLASYGWVPTGSAACRLAFALPDDAGSVSMSGSLMTNAHEAAVRSVTPYSLQFTLLERVE